MDADGAQPYVILGICVLVVALLLLAKAWAVGLILVGGALLCAWFFASELKKSSSETDDASCSGEAVCGGGADTATTTPPGKTTSLLTHTPSTQPLVRKTFPESTSKLHHLFPSARKRTPAKRPPPRWQLPLDPNAPEVRAMRTQTQEYLDELHHHEITPHNLHLIQPPPQALNAFGTAMRRNPLRSPRMELGTAMRTAGSAPPPPPSTNKLLETMAQRSLQATRTTHTPQANQSLTR